MKSPSRPDHHHAQHRAVGDSSGIDTAQHADSPQLHGKGTGGMWWVAWRQHRIQIAITLGVILTIVAAMVVFRAVLVARFAAAGCSPTDASSCTQPGGSDLFSGRLELSWNALHLVVTAAPVHLGCSSALRSFRASSSRTPTFSH